MKKIGKINVMALCAVTLLCSMVVGSNAQVNNEEFKAGNRIKENEVRISDFEEADIQVYKPDDEYPYEKYEYPITPQKTPEIWREFTDHQQMLDACEIPEDILKSMTTQQLLLTCLDYPLVGDAMFYDSEISGFNSVKSRNNGMTELFERSDFSAELVALYQDYAASVTNASTKSNIIADSTAEDQIFCLTRMTRYALEEGDLRACDAVAIYNCCAEISSQIVDTTLEYRDFFGVCQKAEAMAAASGGSVAIGDKTYNYTIVTVKTPKGSSVEGWNIEGYLNAKELTRYMKYMSANYPRATLVSLPTISYNCHSYAWYQANEQNQVWINDPAKYMTDGSYKYVGSIAAVLPNPIGVVPGNKAFYKNPTGNGTETHSAIVYSSSEYISKWGAGYLVRHVPVYCPYWDADAEIRIYS